MLQRLADAVWGAARRPLLALVPTGLMDRLRRYKARHFRYERHGLVHRSTDLCIIDEVYDEQVYGPPELYAPGQVVFDLGGHIGAFATYAARRVGPGGRVVVCEPAPRNLELLRANTAGLPQVHLHAVAVSDKPGQAILRQPDNPAANTLFAVEGEEVEVPLSTLDAVWEAEGRPAVDHLKIDIEGAELQALRGGPKVLAATRRVVLELHPQHVDVGQVLALLRDAGFTVRATERFVEAAR